MGVRVVGQEGRVAETADTVWMRIEAERVPRALAGEQARLREDQWQAIEDEGEAALRRSTGD